MSLNRSPPIHLLLISRISRVPPFPYFHVYLFYTFLNPWSSSAMNAPRQKRLLIQQQRDNLYTPPACCVHQYQADRRLWPFLVQRDRAPSRVREGSVSDPDRRRQHAADSLGSGDRIVNDLTPNQKEKQSWPPKFSKRIQTGRRIW